MAISICFIGCHGVSDRVDRPSVVFLTIDTLREDHVSRNGHARETTPYLDRLAAEGVYCSRCFAQSSWTLPSMLSMISSLNPPTFGITDGVTPLDRNPDRRQRPREQDVLLEYFADDHVTLAEILADAGYVTAGFSTNGHLRVAQGFAQGFETYDESSCMWGTAECIFAAATAWLDSHEAARDGRPFFLWIHLLDPHFDRRRDRKTAAPLYEAPTGYDGLFDVGDSASLEERVRVAYDRKVRYTDDRIREFVEALRSRGVLDRSVLIVASDHGEEFNEKGRWGHSRALTNALVHVPLVFRFPGGRPRGVVDACVGNVDIAPTVLDYLGLPVPPEMQGTSLLPAFHREPFEPVPVYGETRRWQQDLRFRVDPARDRKLVLDLQTGDRALFSVSGDPTETTDLSVREPEVADAIARDLEEWIADLESRAITAHERGALSAEELEHLRALGYVR